MDTTPFVNGSLDLFLKSRHFIAFFQAGQLNFLRSRA